MKLPLVTVVVTNYNYERYIIPCLESIASQTYPNYKCVVVDDCSRDKSPDLVQGFIESRGLQGKFKIVFHEKNMGQMAAFKTGLEHAEGVYVVYVDADDLLLEDFIYSHVKVHTDFFPVAFTSSDQYQINDNNEILSGTHSDLQAGGEYKYVKAKALFEPYWVWATTSSMMFRKSVLHHIMPDDCEPFRVCADNYICHFANLIGGSLLVPAVHGCYRRHSSNYFCCNQIVGGRLPFGALNRHPHHSTLRTSIFLHLIRNHDRFCNLLSETLYTTAVALVMLPHEMVVAPIRYHKYLSGKSRSLCLKSIFKSLMVRIRFLLERHRRAWNRLFRKVDDDISR